MISNKVLAALAALAMFSFANAKEAEAEEPEPTPYPVQVVEFQLAPTPTPTVPDFVIRFEERITEHQLNPEDVELLARMLYRSPLRHEDYKRELCWVVFNRIDDERAGLFGRTIQEVVIPSEFTYLPGEYTLTEENLQIVREEMNRWMSYLDGNYVELPIPREMVYASFYGTGNRQLKVQAEIEREERA